MPGLHAPREVKASKLMACVPVKQHVQAFTLCLQKSSGQDSLAWKMLCALTSSGLATLGLLDPSLVPHSP